MTLFSFGGGGPPRFLRRSVSGAYRSPGVFLAALATYVFLLAGYIGMRFAWHSLDIDAIKLTALSGNVLAEGTLSPASGGYAYGYAYPALNTFLAHLTGVPLETLQTVVQPFLVVLLVPMTYSAYRCLIGSAPVALLASLLLFLSPEFLFEATRSSHAKVTWLLALTTLFVLARSFRTVDSPRQLATWVVLLYLAAYALISSSSFFASGYIFGIAIAFAASYIIPYLTRSRGIVSPAMRRLSYVTASTAMLVFLFVFYLYPPAVDALWSLRWTLDQLSVFILNVEPAPATNPYTYVQSTWLSTPVYLALTAFNWIILLLSFAVWLHRGWLLLVRRVAMPPHRLLVWLLYASFGLLMVISVVADVAGVLSANLQVRLFPHFLLVGIPLAGEAIVASVQWARRSRVAVMGKLAPVSLVVLISYFSLASLLKITNEPLLSNWWPLYTVQERLSVEWIGDYVRLNQVWFGRDSRLFALATAYGEWEPEEIGVDWSATPVRSRYVLMSEISERRSARMETALPDIRGYNKIHDAGESELYYRRPQTPYQR